MDIKTNFYPCAHCERTGTCTNAANGASCAACVKFSELKGSAHVGLPCGTCNGLGQAESKTDRLNKRIQPVLGLIVVSILLFGVFLSAIFQTRFFSEILAFSGPLVGLVLAFYFTGRSTQRSTEKSSK